MPDFARPRYFLRIKHHIFMVSTILAIMFWSIGLYLALIDSPVDYKQGAAVRIMYVHVPAAWMALFIYASIAMASLAYLIWRHVLAGLYIRAAAIPGLAMTFICLVTGAIWGAPSWGTWWVWDARLTSVLILLFLYLGLVLLSRSFDNPDQGLHAASWLGVIGAINLPIIKFSVDWWNTLHQPASISSLSRLGDPAIHPAFLQPLLIMAVAYFTFFLALVVIRLDQELRLRKLYLKENTAPRSRGYRQKDENRKGTL